jgi:hypothetical protein
MHPEGPANGHTDKGFLGFPLILKKLRVQTSSIMLKLFNLCHNFT